MNPEERYGRLLSGHVEGIDEHITALTNDTEPVARAWATTLSIAVEEANPERAAATTSLTDEDIETVPTSPEEARVVLLGYLHHARRAFVQFDQTGATAWLGAAARLEHYTDEPSPALALEAELASLERGDHPQGDRGLRGVATKHGDAATVIGLGVAQAIAADLSDDFVGALRAARRASRMARTEAMPQQEYLANVTLARSRRLVGHPHLAARILRSLLEIASTQWQPWIAWELLLAGAIQEARQAAETHRFANTGTVATATTAALALLDAAREGEPRRFDAAVARLRKQTTGSRRLHRDAAALIGALDVREPLGQKEGTLHSWARGEDPRPPRGLHGLAAAVAGSAQMKDALVFVAAGPKGGRRILMPGPRLLGEEFHPVLQSQRQQGRMDTMVAVLALAGPTGLETEDLFRRVYGFAFDPDIHRGALRKLLARVEAWLVDFGTLFSDDDQHRLDLHTSILVADPRCAPPVDVRVLGVLATRGSTSAREAAKRLDIPLRTAQAALQSLLQDGACLRVREGNRVAYQIEDTTFSEPTQR